MTADHDPAKRSAADAPRAPRAFVPTDDEARQTARPETAPPRRPTVVSGAVALTEAEDDPFLREALELPPAAPRRRRRLTPGKILLSALGLLLSLAIGLWVDQLVRSLFDRLPWLGWTALGLAAIALIAFMLLLWREIRGLMRLARVAELRAEVDSAEVDGGGPVTAAEARRLSHQVSTFLGNRAQTARGRAALKALDGEIVDGPQLLAFAERELLATLDREARKLIVNAARRVSLVTAISPRASLDMLYVAWEALRLVRAMAILYGGRPGTFGLLRLFRDVIAHLAVTGTVAAGDSILQQAIGTGVAAKLSARLGEGVINGLMTARIGISAMDLCRPMPFKALRRPRVSEFFTDLSAFAAKNSGTKSAP
ncbi:YcjF family protein [Pseudohoeflea coraliihabitans]|uniref:YcjF family protein n=1 Tax=Pseudohoeflea coraliihabitans TaxID=2860393 RepID=A0ABS6WQ38_9HYPH|nr:TIGR01620 family protein [Pseudohoeflea sp. DP4N28-3]MBW3098066.1 YcjF family protein [Pseudohoeflea sp. DP4N28-3]